MKKLFKLMIVTATFCVVSTGFATSLSGTTNTVGAKAGPYVGVAAGIGGINTPKLPSHLAGNVSEHLRNGVSARVYGGYLWAIPQSQNLKLGAELGYNMYPDNKYEVKEGGDGANGDLKFEYKGYNIDLLGVAKYNFAGTGFNVAGKAGVAYTEQEYSLSGHGEDKGSYDRTKTKILPKIGVGLGYDINQHIGVGLTYYRVFGKTPTKYSGGETVSDVTKVADVNTLLLGATYHF